MPEQPKNSEQHLAIFGIYSPGSMSPEQLLEEFIARRRQLDTALKIVCENRKGEPQQHLLVVGPRGMGKTMLLLAMAYTIERDAELAGEWLPVIFPEETYGIGDLADFWLEGTGHLLAATGNESEIERVETLREENPEDIEEQAREMFLRYLEGTGKRALVVLENVDEFFSAVNDEAQQHRLRAFLMEDDRLMIAASSPSYFDETGELDMPFYDFFRTIRLERLNRDEMIGMLDELAGVRVDGAAVKRVIREEPGRIESLRVLTGGNPRLVKLVYRLLAEGGQGSARRDLERLLEDCTPYFKHRIEEIRSIEERRAFDHVARHWDPVAVKDVAKALRRPSNKVSIYLGRLVDAGFLEEAPGSFPKRKAYQVAERFYNIYYLMRFSRSARRRLEWLVQAMRVFYSENDFKVWVQRTLRDWRDSTNPAHRADREAFLYSLTKATEGTPQYAELAMDSVHAAWEHDRFKSLDRLLERDLGKQALGETFDLIEFLAGLSVGEKESLGYRPDDASWWRDFGYELQLKYEEHSLGAAAFRKSIELDPETEEAWMGLGFSLFIEDRPDNGREAESAFRKAIELAPEDPSAWRGLGLVLADRLDRFDEAELAFRRAIEIIPDHPDAWICLGVVLEDRLNRPDEAEKAFRKTIEIEPESAAGHARLADNLWAKEKKSEAKQEAMIGVRLHPSVQWTRNTFRRICGEDAESWKEVLPTLLEDQWRSDEDVYEMALRGIEFVVTESALTPVAAANLIEEAGAEDRFADVLLALRAADDRDILLKASPERRAFAEDFLARIEGKTGDSATKYAS